MAIDSHEEEQVEAIKKWWKENGIAVVFGVAIGFAILFGWRAWQNYTRGQAELASNYYEQVVNLLNTGDATKANEIAQTLLNEQPNSTYATLVSLFQAQQNIKDKQLETAKVRLQWVIENAKTSQIVEIAKLRKTRLLIDEKNYTDALTIIENNKNTTFNSIFADLKGDIYLAQNDLGKAKEAYKLALANNNLSNEHRNIIQMKFDDLGSIVAISANKLNLPIPKVESELANQTTLALNHQNNKK
jgi:predicted negative regulator of RcsB-dependent stress response